MFCFVTKAQNETNHWYFGNYSGIDFNNGQFTTLSDGSMSTPAGCASISDSNGDLLFYTNGQTVWNKNHEVMTNGNDLNAEIENNQSCIIIPDPSDINNYYILTTRINPDYGGVFYSKVVFNAQNPLGFIFTKNNRITTTSTERITAVYSPETNSYKAVGLGKVGGSSEPTFNALFVINVGTLGTAPLNNITLENTITLQETYYTTLGPIKFSPNGQLIAIGDSSSSSSVYIYDFNPLTNSASYQQSFNAGYIFNPIPVEGLEFSADSEYLYITGNLFGTAYLHQYIVNSSASFNEKILLATSQSINFGALQLASDSKIYMANYATDSPYHLNTLGVIHSPEDPDDINFEPSSITLVNSASTKGLPNFVTSYFRNRIIAKDDCFYETIDFSLDAYGPITSANWEFGDGNTATGLNPSHQYTQSGTYIVRAVITVGTNQIELFKKIKAHPVATMTDGYTLSQCDIDNDGISNFNLTEAYNGLENGVRDNYQYQFYETQLDADNDTNPITNPEFYTNTSNPQELFLNITNEFGCVNIDSFYIEVQSQDLVVLDPYIVCEDSNDIYGDYIGRFNLADKIEELSTYFNLADDEYIRFHSTLEDALSNTNPLYFEYDTISTTLWIIVRKTNGDCGIIASMELQVNQPIEFDIEDSYQLCMLQPNPVLDGGVSNDSWKWQDTTSGAILSTQRFYELSNPGTYQLTVTKLENGLLCTKSKVFNVLAPVLPTFEVIEIDGTNLYISINGNSQYEFSLNNQNFFGQNTAYTFYDVEPGIIEIFVRDVNDCEQSIQTEVSFIYYPKFFTPNDDNKNDKWSVFGVNDNLYKKAEVTIFDRFGKKLYGFTLKTIHRGWDGMYNNVPLPNSDYWFKVTLVDQNDQVIESSGHFTLKR
ncbi:T9SS type B sorting domain-containing protein [Olleya sp. YS]|uniref:T9SS type B sorting domain-containing protein n=1 Tax=Olleya sp. YS TaxID=3028318 RepID=UPI0024344CFD|nr:T9SS type B sorting domain-containing protein [Olleya sp. YS]WGD35296.1 T9SS type B sorting domain-containing protein [Olleya sp. YS]